MNARLQIRRRTAKSPVGFLIVGRDSYGRSVKIFTLSRVSAEKIRDKVRAGEIIELADFEEGAPR